MPGEYLVPTGTHDIWVCESAWEPGEFSYWAIAPSGEHVTHAWLMVRLGKAVPLLSKCVSWFWGRGL